MSRSTDWPRRSASSAGESAGDPGADAALLVGQAGHCLVDQIRRVRLAPPRQQQLDRPVRHLALRRGRLPLEVVGQQVELLAVEHRGDLVLGDEHLLVRLQAFGEVVERHTHLGADVGDEIGIEHERIARPAQRVERADLHRGEGRSVRGVAHRRSTVFLGATQ